MKHVDLVQEVQRRRARNFLVTLAKAYAAITAFAVVIGYACSV